MTFLWRYRGGPSLRSLSLCALAGVGLLLAACGEAPEENAGAVGSGSVVEGDAGTIGGIAADTVAAADGSEPDLEPGSDTVAAVDSDDSDTAVTDQEVVDLDAPSNCPGAPGCVCSTNGDCDNSICLDTPEGKRCAATCVDVCDKGYTCQNVGATDVVFVCVPDFLTLCSPCTTTKDCSDKGSASLCLDYGDAGSFCGGPCKADADCPQGGYTCDEVLNPETKKLTKQCKLAQVDGKQPVCGCSVWAKAAAFKTGCKVNNALGTCSGERQCVTSGMGPCNAKTPAEESCNGIDDDCNGVTDILGASKTCSKSAWLPIGSQKACAANSDCTEAGESCNPGKSLCQKLIGTCSGVASCSGGAEVCTAVKTPKAEACNGEDDDCDGDADEDFAWTNPLTLAAVPVGGVCGLGPCGGGNVACESQLTAICTTETKKKSDACNGEDDDCDGITDDGACDDGSACTADVCDASAKSCSNDGKVDCDDKNPCTSESCNAKDGGCVFVAVKGSCDDGDACTVGDSCEPNGKAVAKCAPGATAKVCDDANLCTDDSCDPKLGCVQLPNAVTQVCYDGDKATVNVGLCVAGVKACNNGKLDGTCVGQVMPSKVELCDNKDDSCDGITDEGCKATAVAGGFATSSARIVSNGKNPKMHAVLGDGGVGGTAAAPSGKTLKSGFVAWIQSLIE